MLDIWTKVDEDLKQRILGRHETATGEKIVAAKSEISKTDIAPYSDYSFFRIEYMQQRVQIGDEYSLRCFDLVDKTYSYLLVNLSENDIKYFPLKQASQGLYLTNERLGLRINRDNVLTYLQMFGQIVVGESGAFNFILNTKNIASAIRSLPEDGAKKIMTFLESSYQIGPDGRLAIDVKEKTYPILGTSFRFTIPVIYRGVMFNAKMNVSSIGLVAMDEEARTTINGLDDFSPRKPYYPLETSQDTERLLLESQARMNRPVKLFQITLLAERVLSILLTPTFLLTLYIALAYGFEDPDITDFFTKVAASNVINIFSLVVGSLLLCAVFMRYSFFEIVRLTEKLVPTTFTHLYDTVRKIARSSTLKLGVMTASAISFVEILLSVFVAMTIWTYGFVNVFLVYFGMFRQISFLDAILTVVDSLPGASYLQPLLGINYTILTENPGVPIVPIVVAFYIGTILVGLTFRIIQLSRASDD